MTTKLLYGVLGLGLAGFLSICDLCNRTLAAAPVVVPAPAVRALQIDTVTLAIKGMTCGGCVLGVRTVLTRLPGVSSADVSYEKGRAVVTYDPARVTVAQMVAAIATLKYTATPVTSKAG